MNRVIVKIDLCGSKEFFNRIRAGEIITRQNVLEKMVAVVRQVFPHSDKYYPEGSYYSDEGDAIQLVLERPTVAVRCAIEFQKIWYSNIPSLPDLRIVMDYGDVQEGAISGRVRLSGSVFENVSRIEKEYSSGQVGITSDVKDSVDTTLATFLKRAVVSVTAGRSVQTWLVNYENPRTLGDSALAHALFIADPSGDDVRSRTFEALIVECLLPLTPPKASTKHINTWLTGRGCPKLPESSLIDLVGKSQHLELSSPNEIALRPDSKARFGEMRNEYEAEAREAMRLLSNAVTPHLKSLKDFDFRPVVEEYLCAVCLEIRMMANYFRSTNSLFQRLSETSEFDYVLKRNFHALSDKQEDMALLKRLLIDALMSLVAKKNAYIAAIFHNVLMLYYLNRTTSTCQGSLPSLKEKRIFLDTSAFYSLRCDSMLFHDILKFSISRLSKVGATISLFDKSLEEYNQSLESALHNVKKNRGVGYLWKSHAPFIWTEFVNNQSRYANKFEFCVALHRIPQGKEPATNADFNEAARALSSEGIELIELQPYKTRDELGQIYNDVHTAKDAKDRAPEPLFNLGVDFFHERVLHDANCINALINQTGDNPYSSKSVFVTCDFYLAKIRKVDSEKYGFLTTAPEFFEFMLPYLFGADTISEQPIETPNFLLASALSAEMHKGLDLQSLYGSFISGQSNNNITHYDILSEINNDERYKKIRSKWQDEKGNKDPAAIDACIVEVQQGFVDYLGSIRDDLEESLLVSERNELGRKLAQEENKSRLLGQELDKYKHKERGRDKHLRRLSRHKPKN